MSIDTTKQMMEKHEKIDTIDELKSKALNNELVAWLERQAQYANSYAERVAFIKVIKKIKPDYELGGY